jgi:hypothetical protein
VALIFAIRLKELPLRTSVGVPMQGKAPALGD